MVDADVEVVEEEEEEEEEKEEEEEEVVVVLCFSFALSFLTLPFTSYDMIPLTRTAELVNTHLMIIDHG